MIEFRNVSKIYHKGEMTFPALKNVSFGIEKGELCAVTGPSGSGKSTLLNICGGLVKPDEGEVFFEGSNIYHGSGRDASDFRKEKVSFVFQQFHLIPYLTVYENVRMACNNTEQAEKINKVLDTFSLSGHARKYPSELSVGEKQRTAFIRAIISEPALLLADEPTGNLDEGNSAVIYSLIEDYNSRGGTVILVTHSNRLPAGTQKIIRLNEGTIN